MTSKKIKKRDEYTVKQFMRELKTLGPTPSVFYSIGREIFYYEWSCAEKTLGPDHPVTTNWAELLEFAQYDYENKLVQGELWRVKDTPRSAINAFLRGRPDEFLKYPLERDGASLYRYLISCKNQLDQEISKYEKIEDGIRKELEENPEDPDVWNQLRLVLWLQKKHKKASEAFKKARKLGWDSETSHLVAI